MSEVNWAPVSTQWKILSVLDCLVFVTLFVYIGPTVVCLFEATEDTHDGFRQITVEGPSPVGFRSLIGNYFFSTDCTMWHIARKFFMHVVILPLPFLVPATFVEYLLYKNVLSSQTSVKESTHLFRPLKMACYACYCFKAFFFYFTHSIVRRLSVELWGDGWASLVIFEPAKTFSSVWSSCTVSISSALSFFARYACHLFLLFILQMITFFFHIQGLVLHCPLITLCPPVSRSLWQLTDVNFLYRHLLFPARLAVVLLDILVSCLAAFGVVFVLQYVAVGVMIFLQFAFLLVVSQQNLPEDGCCVVFACYLWKSYRSFIQKYQDLAVTLFEKHRQLKDNGRKTSLNMQNITPDYGRTIDDVKRIPKALFDMACEELMPVRESACKVFLETALSALLVFPGFTLATLLNVSPAIKALSIFTVALIPNIVTIFLDGRRRRNFEAQHGFDQNVGEIVKKFFNTVPFRVVRGQRAVYQADSCNELWLLTSVVSVSIPYIVVCVVLGMIFWL